jgi:hypothetical protein
MNQPIDKTGVHRTHCCSRHGCKYGEDNCPVVTGEVIQEYPCEYCEEDPAPIYQVHYIQTYLYYDNDNYLCSSDDGSLEEYLCADSIEELYEKMAKCLVDWKITGEERCKNDSFGLYAKDTFDVEFSPIYIYVDEYSSEKLKATKTYQEIGVARDIAKKKREEKEKADALRRAENARILKEKEEKAIYNRLKKKYEKS